jgi:hypothetical protein
MMTFLTAKSLFGAPRWLLGLGIILALGIVAAVIVGKIDSTVETISTTARDAGKAEAVVEGNKVTLDQLEKANEAATEIRNDRDNARFCECLRGATKDTARNCLRYSADKFVFDNGADPLRSCSD